MHGPSHPPEGPVGPPLEGGLSHLASGFERFGRASSISNPTQLLNHCVSVSISKILAYPDVHEFWQDTLGGNLPDTPLSVDQTVELIASTGWTVTWKIYLPWNGNSACRNLQLDPKFHLGVFRAVAYTQKGQVGHCVTSGPLGHKYPMTLPMKYPGFVCYQRDEDGIDVSHEVEAAENVFVFYLRCPQSTPQWDSWEDRRFRRMVERRRTEAWQAQSDKISEQLRVAGVLKAQPTEVTKLENAGRGSSEQQMAPNREKTLAFQHYSGDVVAPRGNRMFPIEWPPLKLALMVASGFVLFFVAVLAKIPILNVLYL